MKKIMMILLISVLMWGCTSSGSENKNEAEVNEQEILIELSDEEVQIDGCSESEFVKVDHNIIYYEEGNDETYGKGSAEDAHDAQEAALHTVVTIQEAGVYRVTGHLSYGQIAIDLNEDAEMNPEAVVTLILDNVDLTCTVAPAIVVYHAYECAQETLDSPTKDVDLSGAGFNLVLAEDSINNIQGAYVATIYKPGTQQKQHKYDAAIESLVSLNIKGTGTLNLTAQNEGIETKMHMHIQSGNLNIVSGDDSLNAGEDGVSVIRISDGVVVCNANLGQEGDGIDSNGWLIIEGGTVVSAANAVSQDSGLDSDNGILIHGGNVLATGNMLDQISAESAQQIMVLQSRDVFSNETMLALKQEEDVVAVLKGSADWTVLVYSSSELKEADYTLWIASQAAGTWTGGLLENPETITLDSQLSHSGVQMGMRNPDENFKEMERPEEDFDSNQRPEGMEHLDGEFDFEQFPEDWQKQDSPQRPQEGFEPEPEGIEPPEGDFIGGFQQLPPDQMNNNGPQTNSTVFTLKKNQYSFVIMNLE